MRKHIFSAFPATFLLEIGRGGAIDWRWRRKGEGVTRKKQKLIPQSMEQSSTFVYPDNFWKFWHWTKWIGMFAGRARILPLKQTSHDKRRHRSLWWKFWKFTCTITHFYLFPNGERERERREVPPKRPALVIWVQVKSWSTLGSSSLENRCIRCQWRSGWVGQWRWPEQYRVGQALVE